MNSERIVWADYAKAFSICAVVLYHTQLPNPFKHYVYIFCLPAFFFLSGMFAHKWQTLTTKDFLKKIFIRRIIPYLFWGIVAYIIWIVEQKLTHTDISLWKPLIGLCYGSCNSIIQNKPLWFLTCILIIDCCYFMIQKLHLSLNKQSIIILSIFILGVLFSKISSFQLPWSIGPAMIMLLIYACGDYFYNLYNHTLNTFSNWWLLLFCILSILIIYFIGPLNFIFNISYNKYGNIGIFLIENVCVIILWCCLGIITYRHYSHTFISTIIGEHTLFILGSHLLYFKIIKFCTTFIFHFPKEIYENNYGISLTLSLITIFLSVLTIYILKQFIPKQILNYIS